MKNGINKSGVVRLLTKRCVAYIEYVIRSKNIKRQMLRILFWGNRLCEYGLINFLNYTLQLKNEGHYLTTTHV